MPTDAPGSPVPERTTPSERYRVVQATSTGRWWLWKGTSADDGRVWNMVHEVEEVIASPAEASHMTTPPPPAVPPSGGAGPTTCAECRHSTHASRQCAHCGCLWGLAIPAALPVAGTPEVEYIRHFAEKATPRPWRVMVVESETRVGHVRFASIEAAAPASYLNTVAALGSKVEDADFIVALANAWPALAARLAESDAARSKLIEAIKERGDWMRRASNNDAKFRAADAARERAEQELRPVIHYLVQAIHAKGCKEVAGEYVEACDCGLTAARKAAAPLRQRIAARASRPAEREEERETSGFIGKVRLTHAGGYDPDLPREVQHDPTLPAPIPTEERDRS